MSADSPSDLIFDPNVLYFEPPYNAVKKDVLVIQNTTANKFVFKIKTTSPKVYCVKPNCGFIGPAGTEFDTIEVSLLFNATDASSEAGKKDKFLVEWISMLDGDSQSDAKSLWNAVVADRAKMQHKIIAHVGRRPDSDPASQPSGGSAIRAINKRRIPSKLTASLTVPDTDGDEADLGIGVAAAATAGAAAAGATTTEKITQTQSAVPIIVSAAPVAVVTPSAATTHAADVQTPASFVTPKSSISDDSADVKQLRAQLSQVAQERDKLVSQLAAMQRSLTAATAAATSSASAASSKSSSTMANPVPAPDQGVANYMYVIALLFVVFAFLFGRFSVATNSVFSFGGNNSTPSQ